MQIYIGYDKGPLNKKHENFFTPSPLWNYVHQPSTILLVSKPSTLVFTISLYLRSYSTDHKQLNARIEFASSWVLESTWSSIHEGWRSHLKHTFKCYSYECIRMQCTIDQHKFWAGCNAKPTQRSMTVRNEGTFSTMQWEMTPVPSWNKPKRKQTDARTCQHFQLNMCSTTWCILQPSLTLYNCSWLSTRSSKWPRNEQECADVS